MKKLSLKILTFLFTAIKRQCPRIALMHFKTHQSCVISIYLLMRILKRMTQACMISNRKHLQNRLSAGPMVRFKSVQMADFITDALNAKEVGEKLYSKLMMCLGYETTCDFKFSQAIRFSFDLPSKIFIDLFDK